MPSTEAKFGPRDLLCAAGLAAGVVASYVFIVLTPSLLAHHGLLLEGLAGTNAAIVGGGALARVGQTSLLAVVAAPLATVLLYDVFYWWAGSLWGSRIAAFYTRNNPRAARWVDRAERAVRRGGVWALVVGYYLPIPNYLIFASCGTSGMPLWLFVVGDVIGMLAWEALLVGLGWAIGRPAVDAVNAVSHYALWVTIGLVVAIVVVAAVRGRRASSTPNRPAAESAGAEALAVEPQWVERRHTP